MWYIIFRIILILKRSYDQIRGKIANVAQSRNHAAEQVLEALQQVYPAVAPATIYNNLNKLWAAGQIRKVSHPGMADRYDRTDKHDHLVCARCGKCWTSTWPT